MPGPDAIACSKRCGEIEAEAFDLRLRELESREREARLILLVAEHSDLSAVLPLAPHGDLHAVQQLQRQVQELATFQRAVVQSKGWRLVQMLRRPFGRAW